MRKSSVVEILISEMSLKGKNTVSCLSKCLLRLKPLKTPSPDSSTIVSPWPYTETGAEQHGALALASCFWLPVRCQGTIWKLKNQEEVWMPCLHDNK